MKNDKEQVFIAILTNVSESMSYTDYEIMGSVRDPRSFITQEWFIERLSKDIKKKATKYILENETFSDLTWREEGQSYGYTDYSLTIEVQDLL